MQPGAYYAVPSIEREPFHTSSSAPSPVSEQRHLPEAQLTIRAELLPDSTTPQPQDEEVPEVYKAEPVSRFTRWARTMLLAALAIAVFSLVGGGIAAAVAVGQNTPLLSPTAASVIIGDLLQGLCDREDDALTSQDSPQNRALNWLLIDQNGTESLLSESRLLTRYALAVLYFSTGGPSWSVKADFLASDQHECNWNLGHQTLFGVFCDASDTVLTVSLSNIRLYGSLPSEIGLLSTLQYLQLKGDVRDIPPVPPDSLYIPIIRPETNRMSGTLPTEVWSLTELLQLDLSMNGALEGSLPSEIGKLTRLVELRLNDNQFTGQIPATTKMYSLTYVDLENNRLTGSSTPIAFNGVVCVDLRGNPLVTCPLSWLSGFSQTSVSTPADDCRRYSTYNGPCELRG